MDSALAATWRLPRNGSFADASSRYGVFVDQQLERANMQRLVGTFHFEKGCFARVVELISRAIQQRTDCAALRADLTESLPALGMQGQAIDDRQEALRPEFASALGNSGTSLRQPGRTREAREAFCAAARLSIPILPDPTATSARCWSTIWCSTGLSSRGTRSNSIVPLWPTGNTTKQIRSTVYRSTPSHLAIAKANRRARSIRTNRRACQTQFVLADSLPSFPVAFSPSA